MFSNWFLGISLKLWEIFKLSTDQLHLEVEGWMEEKSRIFQLSFIFLQHIRSFRLSGVIKPSLRMTAKSKSERKAALRSVFCVWLESKRKENTMNSHKIEQWRKQERENHLHNGGYDFGCCLENHKNICEWELL